MHYVWTVFNKNVHTCTCESTIEIDEDFLIDTVSFFTDKKFTGSKTLLGKIYNGQRWHRTIFQRYHPGDFVSVVMAYAKSP